MHRYVQISLTTQCKGRLSNSGYVKGWLLQVCLGLADRCTWIIKCILKVKGQYRLIRISAVAFAFWLVAASRPLIGWQKHMDYQVLRNISCLIYDNWSLKGEISNIHNSKTKPHRELKIVALILEVGVEYGVKISCRSSLPFGRRSWDAQIIYTVVVKSPA